MAFSECISKLSNASHKPSFWWDFKLKDDKLCNMQEDSLTVTCAKNVFRSLGGESKLPGGIASVLSCMGDLSADEENPLLEFSMQVTRDF